MASKKLRGVKSRGKGKKRIITNVKHVIRVRGVLKKIIEDPLKSVGQAMREVGFSDATSLNPTSLTKSKTFIELLDEYMPQGEVLEVHKGLLKAARVDHLVFPLETDELTDAHITEMLAEQNCTVRKIVHGEQARHVYFFAPDSRARKDALDMLYKLRGSYAADKAAVAFSLAALAASRDTPPQTIAPDAVEVLPTSAPRTALPKIAAVEDGEP